MEEKMEMKTARRIPKDSEGTAVFASIPMEKLSGLDETLWLDQMNAKKAVTAPDKNDISIKKSR